MRSSVIGILLSGLVSASALAGPGSELATFAGDIRTEAALRAQLAASRPAAPAEPLDIEDPFYFELEQFSVDALRLSRAVDAAGGPTDLRCIFRGMSADAADRLEALNQSDTSAQQAHVYRAIAGLMRDASEIAPAVDDEAALPEGFAPPASCPARG